MFSNFRKTFKPTKEEKAAQYEVINNLMKEDIEINGHNCRTCVNSRLPINNPYDYATYCAVSDHVTELYETYVCDKHEFKGWLAVK